MVRLDPLFFCWMKAVAVLTENVIFVSTGIRSTS
jgi:hypothetical protein